MNRRSPSTAKPRHGAATEPQILREVAAIPPDGASGSRVDRPGVVVEPGDVEHAVDHDRRRLKTSELTGLERPLGGQRSIFGVICVMWRVLAVVGARVGQPSRRILQPIQQIPVRDQRRRRDGCRAGTVPPRNEPR